MKTGTLVSSLAQSIPYKTQQLKQERVRISNLDILMVWWDIRDRSRVQILFGRERLQKEQLSGGIGEGSATCWEL